MWDAPGSRSACICVRAVEVFGVITEKYGNVLSLPLGIGNSETHHRQASGIC
jgi:hypothetical protein